MISIGQRLGIEVLGKTEPVTVGFETADRFLKRFFIIFADAHYLAHGAHLGAKFVLGAFELLKRPPRKFDNDVVSPVFVLIECAFSPVGNFVQSQPRCEL